MNYFHISGFGLFFLAALLRSDALGGKLAPTTY
jgi:hypothetical protein